MPLRKDDGQVERSMRRGEVLRDVQQHQIDARNGVVLVACGDGDQFHDLYRHKTEILAPQRGEPRIHPLILNGGALLIPHDSPFNRDLPNDGVLLQNIAGAIKLKDIRTIAIYVHAPCGMARSAELNFEEIIRLLVAAKRRIRHELSHVDGLKVAAFCHIHWEDGKRTYHVSADAWDRWVEAPPMSLPPNSLLAPSR